MLVLRVGLLVGVCWLACRCVLGWVGQVTDDRTIQVPYKALNSELQCPVCMSIIREACVVREVRHAYCSRGDLVGSAFPAVALTRAWGTVAVCWCAHGAVPASILPRVHPQVPAAGQEGVPRLPDSRPLATVMSARPRVRSPHPHRVLRSGRVCGQAGRCHQRDEPAGELQLRVHCGRLGSCGSTEENAQGAVPSRGVGSVCAVCFAL